MDPVVADNETTMRRARRRASRAAGPAKSEAGEAATVQVDERTRCGDRGHSEGLFRRSAASTSRYRVRRGARQSNEITGQVHPASVRENRQIRDISRSAHTLYLKTAAMQAVPPVAGAPGWSSHDEDAAARDAAARDAAARGAAARDAGVREVVLLNAAVRDLVVRDVAVRDVAAEDVAEPRQAGTGLGTARRPGQRDAPVSAETVEIAKA